MNRCPRLPVITKKACFWLLLARLFLCTTGNLWTSCHYVLKIRKTSDLNSSYALSVPDEAGEVVELEHEVRQVVDVDELVVLQFPYVLAIAVSCVTEDGMRSSKSNGYVLRGSVPAVEIHFEPVLEDGKPGYMQSFTLHSLLLDLEKHPIDVCPYEICDVQWLIPYVNISNLYLWTVTVENHGGFAESKLNDLFFTGIHSTHELLTAEFELDMPLTVNTRGVRMGHVYKFSTSLAFIVADDSNKEVIVVSSNDFEDVTYIDIESLELPTGFECSCEISPEPVIITLQTEWILLKDGTLYKIPLKTLQNNDTDPIVLVDGCVNFVASCSQGYAHEHFLMISGACQDKGKLLLQDIVAISALNFSVSFNETVLDDETCQTLFNDSKASCDVLDAQDSSFERGIALLLMDVTLSTGKEQAIVTMSFLQTPPKISVQPKYNFSSRVTYISVEHIMSTYLYAWGNNVYVSDNFGKKWMLPEELNKEILALAAEDGTVVILTKNNEIFVSAKESGFFTQIYPANTWNGITEVFNLNDMPSDAKLLTIYLSNRQELILLYTSFQEPGNLVKAFHLPYRDMLIWTESQQNSLAFVLNRQNELTYIAKYQCLFYSVDFWLLNRRNFTRLKDFLFRPPLVNFPLGFHNRDSVIVYMSAMESLDAFLAKLRRETYTRFEEGINLWRASLSSALVFDEYLFRNDLLEGGLFLDLNWFELKYEDEAKDAFTLPELVYLDKYGTYKFTVMIVLKRTESNNYISLQQELERMELEVQALNPEVVTVQAFRTVHLLNDSVQYDIAITNDAKYRNMARPGSAYYSTSLHVHLVGAIDSCLTFDGRRGAFEGIHTIAIKLGCPPNLDISFNYELSQAILRTPEVYETPADCFYPDPELPCVYYGNRMFPVFQVKNVALNLVHNYTGRYILLVIGGGKSKNLTMYTEEEIVKYNSLTAGPSMINPLNELEQTEEGYPIFSGEDRGFTWLCQQDLPCEGIFPVPPATPEYYFVLRFSNAYGEVDIDATHCDFTFEFMLKLHGLPLSDAKQATVILGCTIVVICLYVVFYYCRNRKNIGAQKSAAKEKDNQMAKLSPRRSEIEQSVLHKLSQDFGKMRSTSGQLLNVEQLYAMEASARPSQSPSDTNRFKLQGAAGTSKQQLSVAEKSPASESSIHLGEKSSSSTHRGASKGSESDT